jgi:hypothetical protein
LGILPKWRAGTGGTYSADPCFNRQALTGSL